MSDHNSTKKGYIPPHLRGKFAAKDKPQENGLNSDDKKTLDRIIDNLSGLTPHLAALANANAKTNKRDSMLDNAEFAGHVKDLIETTQGTTLDDEFEPALEVVLPSEPSLQSDSKVEESNEWRPYAVTQMPVFDGKSTISAGVSDVKFTKEQLLTLLGGHEYSPGTYFNSKLDRTFLPGGTYYLIDSHLDPYVPTEPGSNGAKLIAFFPDEGDDDEAPQPDFNNAPLFISVEPDQYIYMGHYSQTRYSDSLDHDTMSHHVPVHVKEYWAEQLARLDRPEWVTEKLVKRLWPYEEYKITAPGTDTETETTEATEVSEEEIEKFRYWFRGYAWHLSEKYTKANFLKKEDILDLFEAADCDEVPGLRLQWEYLQCVEFDPGRFFATLTKGKEMLSGKQ